MNKLKKGVVVGGLGAALLLGTGGSLALWNVGANSDAGTVTMGDLDLAIPADGKIWELSNGVGGWSEISSIEDFRMVPGDVVRLTQPLDVTLVGDQLAATLSIDTTDAVTAGPGGGTLDDYFTVTSSFGAAPNGESLPRDVNGDGTLWAFDNELVNGTATFTQRVFFELSEDTPERVGVQTVIDLSSTDFVLEQVIN